MCIRDSKSPVASVHPNLCPVFPEFRLFRPVSVNRISVIQIGILLRECPNSRKSGKKIRDRGDLRLQLSRLLQRFHLKMCIRDRDTTGLLIIAKNALSGAILSQMMKDRQIRRTYLAIVKGCLLYTSRVWSHGADNFCFLHTS